jgi:hypothetical protein
MPVNYEWSEHTVAAVWVKHQTNKDMGASLPLSILEPVTE